VCGFVVVLFGSAREFAVVEFVLEWKEEEGSHEEKDFNRLEIDRDDNQSI